MIKRTSSGWRATTLETCCQSGLRSTLEGLLDLTPVADTTAHLDADTITVRLDDTGQSWDSECSGPVRQAVIEMGGITLVRTTAFNPAELRELRSSLTWWAVARQPWDGSLLRALSLEAAQQWAQTAIYTTMDIPPEELIGWQQVGGDPQPSLPST